MPLQGDTRQGMARIVGLRRDADHDAGIGVALIARILAHPIGDDAQPAFAWWRPPPCRRGNMQKLCTPRPFLAWDAPAGNRPRPAGARCARSAPCRSVLGDVRCESRWRKAWPRWRRRVHAASRMCRGRYGPAPARRDRWHILLRRFPAARRRQAALIVEQTDQPPCCRKPIFSAQLLDGLRRMLSTMVTRRKVPIWGWASVRISSGAPALTNSVASTLRPRWRGSLIWLCSLPSETQPRRLRRTGRWTRGPGPSAATGPRYPWCGCALLCRVPG